MNLWEFIISHLDEILDQATEHIILTLVSMLLASVTGISIGILITRIEKMATITLGFVGVIQTIPSLALLGFLLPLVGIGTTPAIIALFLYALLPIVRNTYTGLKGIDPDVKEASVGMGMNRWQLFRYVELPLAFPVILAGIRTSTVINVGIATLCALIAAGGLGEFIFRGITLNHTNMILAGAIPASILAILLDQLIGFFQKHALSRKALLAIIPLFFLTISPFLVTTGTLESRLIAGFNSEFIERADGFIGLDSLYSLPMEIKEMEISLMYRALHEGEVDVIDGFSTDGRIQQFNLASLEDDKHYFPPYYAVPLVNSAHAETFPELVSTLKLLENTISDTLMAKLNYQIDGLNRPVAEVANAFLKSIGIYANPDAGQHEDADIIIGSKAFTENYLLAYIFSQLLENKTKLTTQLKLGFGGTKLVFDALRLGEVHVYPEYTGTAYLVLLNKVPEEVETFSDPEAIYQIVKEELRDDYGIETLPSLGFNNTFALMMRTKHADSLGIKSISDLSRHLNTN